MGIDVSVVVRAADAAATLEATVQSILSQPSCELEAVVVDDCSCDDTPRLAAELSLQEPDRVRVISHTTPQGALESYRSGITASRGEHLLLMDSGDLLAPGALAKLLEAAREEQADIVAPSLAYMPAPTQAAPQPAKPLADDQAFSDDDTGQQARLVSPLLQTLEKHAIAQGLFRTQAVPVSLKGRLFSADLAKHAFAEIERDRLAERDEAAASFIIATMAERMAVRPDLRSLTIVEEATDAPLSLEEFQAICANRTTAEVVVDYLTRTEQWETFFEDWEGLAVMLCGEAVSRFPERLSAVDWAEGADALLSAWGAPYVVAAAEATQAEPTSLALGLASASSLKASGARPEHLCVLVRGDDSVTDAVRLYDALKSRRTSCSFLAEKSVALPNALPQLQPLPEGASALARARALGKALQEAEADGLVVTAGDAWSAGDELVARSLGIPVALVATAGAADAVGYCDLSAQAALATCVVPKNPVDAELWGILGARVGTAATVPAKLALGSPAGDDLDRRDLLSRLARWARRQKAQEDQLKASATEAILVHERLCAERDELERRVQVLEERLRKTTEERDELEATVQDLSSQGLFKRMFRGK